jgi:NAD(P)-dependent dehydrogenase (short-subunit alcohol dehydrogenase family)
MPLALITGASTGIGEATALRLARGGWTVLAGVRDEAAAERLTAKANDPAGGRGAAGAGDASAARTPGGVIPITLDVTDADQIAQAVARVRADSNGAGAPDAAGRLDALVNNAGIGVGGPLEIVALDELRTQFEVNLIGSVAVTQALLPALRSARGRIVFTSSIGGKVATPFLAPYAASKHAIEAIGDALRLELRTSNVSVALIEPGSVATPIWDKGRADAQRISIPAELDEFYGRVPETLSKVLDETEKRGIPPEQVAQAIERALTERRMKARYLVGRDARGLLLIRRLLPDAWFDRVLRRALGV